MNARSSLIALALLALASCNAADPAPQAADNRADANLAAAAPPARPVPGKNEARSKARLDELDYTEAKAGPADPAAVTRSWFAGRWTDTGDCAQAAQFAANGTYLHADGTRGMWNVQDSRLVIQNATGRTAIRLRRVGNDAVETVSDDGSTGRSTRCRE